MDMTPEQKRIAIAEACGWKKEYADIPTWDSSLNNYQGDFKPVHTAIFRKHEKAVLLENLPDYPNDLNAMHEAEKVLTVEQKEDEYQTHLNDVVARHRDGLTWGLLTYLSVHATAAQRAEAFGKTLGLWT